MWTCVKYDDVLYVVDVRLKSDLQDQFLAGLALAPSQPTGRLTPLDRGNRPLVGTVQGFT